MSYDDWKTTEPVDPYTETPPDEEECQDEIDATAFVHEWDPANDPAFVAWCDAEEARLAAGERSDYPILSF
jgi:hypothetical protein